MLGRLGLGYNIENVVVYLKTVLGIEKHFSLGGRCGGHFSLGGRCNIENVVVYLKTVSGIEKLNLVEEEIEEEILV